MSELTDKSLRKALKKMSKEQGKPTMVYLKRKDLERLKNHNPRRKPARRACE